MTWFNALQLVFAAGAAALIARRVRVLLFEAPLDIGPFVRALEVALGAGQVSLALRLSEACAPAWPARLAAVALAEQRRGAAIEAIVEETRLDFEHAAVRGLPAIVALGRMASPLAFIGIILEIGRAFGGGAGLAGLQRGLVASASLERALFTFALGAGTFAVCFTAVGMLRRRARALIADLRRVAELLLQPPAR